MNVKKLKKERESKKENWAFGLEPFLWLLLLSLFLLTTSCGGSSSKGTRSRRGFLSLSGGRSRRSWLLLLFLLLLFKFISFSCFVSLFLLFFSNSFLLKLAFLFTLELSLSSLCFVLLLLFLLALHFLFGWNSSSRNFTTSARALLTLLQ